MRALAVIFGIASMARTVGKAILCHQRNCHRELVYTGRKAVNHDAHPTPRTAQPRDPAGPGRGGAYRARCLTSHPVKQAELLGLADIAPLRQGQSLPDDPGVLERAGHLLGIERALKQLYPDDPASRYASLMLPAAGLDGHPPLLVMLSGVVGIKRVRALLESARKTDRE